jgi:glutamyl-tRNA synthetase
MRTRFAPTPSGYLHRGNAVNALLVRRWADRLGGEVALRIDDVDAPRARDDVVDDILTTLAWLDITWDDGPRTVADLRERWSQALRLDRYRTALDLLADGPFPLFACACSRSDLARSGGARCVGGCRGTRPWRRGDALPDDVALRVGIPDDATAIVSGHSVCVPATDVVIWRRDGLPAYHLVSVVDDADLGITHVLRGDDLRDATATQVLLAPHLGAPAAADAVYVHHRLLLDDSGHKLSKSNPTAGHGLERTDDERAAVMAAADAVDAALAEQEPGWPTVSP